MYRLLFVAGALAASAPVLAQVSDSPVHPNEDVAYSFFVAADGTISESYIMPCHNPNGNPNAGHIAEYWYNKQTGWRGTLLWEWYQHPTIPQYSYWLQYYGPTDYDEDTFVQWCFYDVVIPEVPLTSGVPQTGLLAEAGDWLTFKLTVPERASALTFTTGSGTGDADLYVKYGAQPSDSSYDCRPNTANNAETCKLPNAQAGTYFARLKADAAFSGVTLTGSFKQFKNDTDFAISDYSTINSPISVTGMPGRAPATLSVAVDIIHTYQGELKVDLVAPDGTLYNIHNRTGGGIDNIIKTVTVNASSELANGVWKLRVNDNGGGDVGTLRGWNLKF